MGLKRKRARPAPDFRARVRTTHWWADDAIDRGASDRDKWFRTADPDHLVMLPGERAAEIKWRPLYPWEMKGLGFGDDSESALVSRCEEAFRIGLVSIEGFSLKRSRASTISRIDDATMSEIYGEIDEAELPYGKIVSVIVDAFSDLGDGDAEKVWSGIEERIAPMELSVWLGGHILAASFRAKRAGSRAQD